MIKIAIVHDWLVTYAGSERVLEQILALYPEADLFTLIDFLPEAKRDFLGGRVAKTSFLQKLPLAKSKYRQYLPLMPLAIEQFNLSGYDLVISSSHAVAKGVITVPGQLHIAYIHTPMRYAWNLQNQYLHESGLDKGWKKLIAQYCLHRMRIWDLRSNRHIDQFLANSRFVADQIEKFYHRQAKIIYPPVATTEFTLGAPKEDFFLTASRMVPYKKMDLVVEAFTGLPERRLVVIGDGPDYAKIAAKAKGNVQFLGYQPTSVLKEYLQKAQAFVFAAEEDFGILPVEAQACGTPVIAYGRGGVLETIQGLDQPQPTGVFFAEQTPAALIQAIQLFEEKAALISPETCRANALRFSKERFREEFGQFIEEQVAKRGSKTAVS